MTPKFFLTVGLVTILVVFTKIEISTVRSLSIEMNNISKKFEVPPMYFPTVIILKSYVKMDIYAWMHYTGCDKVIKTN